MEPKSDKILAIGQQRIHVTAITTKIHEDIAFLESKIERMKKMRSPSRTVLATYESMLASRMSVLKWLENHDMISNQHAAQHSDASG
ncbi:hypothetical protein [Teredinibacter turnerae]|uniref:hypothetical protein n=1 Tax=Teredinibacter turnerae TaxID=2426 RepID=UPI0003808887|nr:hypothetical protein [Teredinibacter turnerae]